MMDMKISVIGLGYVGLPLVAEFAKKNINVIAYDINIERIKELENGFDSTNELSRNQLKEIQNNVRYTSDLKELECCNYFLVTVPTPIDNHNHPDLSALINSSRMIGGILKKGDIVIYESTVYPGVTEEICAVELENESGLKLNKDFYVGYSPERINPGDKERTLSKIIKITSGSNEYATDMVDNLYKLIITAGTHKVNSIKTAEAAKVIENTQRDINIAAMNELALILDNMNIDTNEVINAASTKWNFLNFRPGLVGGHCIGVDPYYLSFKSQELGYQPNLILNSRKLNNSMAKFIAEKTIKLMIRSGKRIKDSEIIIFGLTFKENCPDIRNSKVFDLINELKKFETNVKVYDPWINKNQKKLKNIELVSNPIIESSKYDACIVSVSHKQFLNLKQKDYKKILNGDPTIIDIKGIVDKPTWRL